jgi:hypothetical protein
MASACSHGVSAGESAIADERGGDGDEGKEVLGLALVAAVQSAASGEPRTAGRPRGEVPVVAGPVPRGRPPNRT